MIVYSSLDYIQDLCRWKRTKRCCSKNELQNFNLKDVKIESLNLEQVLNTIGDQHNIGAPFVQAYQALSYKHTRIYSSFNKKLKGAENKILAKIVAKNMCSLVICLVIWFCFLPRIWFAVYIRVTYPLSRLLWINEVSQVRSNNKNDKQLL